MIYCKIMGGLGNQLFQIFTTIAHAFKMKHTFLFSNVTVLGNRNTTYWKTFLSSLQKTINNNQNIEYHINYFYQEPEFQYNALPTEFSLNDNVELFGYFQSYKYFEKYKTEIFDLIGLRQKIQSVSQLYNDLMHNYENIVSMHFRLGDYVHYPNNHPILPASYYSSALKHIQNKLKKEITVLYFCEENDILKVEHTIQQIKLPNITFIKCPHDIPDWQQMLMMSLCDHHIIANSTFSWWGAYFDDKPNPIICYPEIWFGPALKQHNLCDLYPPNWTKIT